MARGWESKDAESQRELAEEAARNLREAAAMTPDQRDKASRREGLLSQRSRVATDLARATHPRHRSQLEAALAHVDAELAKLQ
ncbi:MAG: hypothetical protein FJW31_06970 [Acidobacteria bacterium]|nr:hypothetical protein [Acidobacteriota bacterium]